MRNFLQAFLVFLCWAALAYFMNSTSDKEVMNESPTLKMKPTSTVSTTTVDNTKIKTDTDSTKMTAGQSEKKAEVKISNKETSSSPKPFRFKHKFITHNEHGRVLFPKEFSYFKDSIYQFLNTHQDREILIETLYLTDGRYKETEGLGMARAQYLKEKLIRNGVNPLRIKTQTKGAVFEYDPEGYYAEGVQVLHRGYSSKTRTELSNNLQKQVWQPTVSKDKIIADNALNAYVCEVAAYLKQHPEKQLIITGHTFSSGIAEADMEKGLKLANAMADVFKSRGVQPSQIKTLTKGASEPLVANNKRTKKKNKRIEIVIN